MPSDKGVMSSVDGAVKFSGAVSINPPLLKSSGTASNSGHSGTAPATANVPVTGGAGGSPLGRNHGKYFIGIDVGSGSARAGVFDGEGRKLGHHAENIKQWKETPDHVEQSSDNIWEACCKSSTEAIKKSGVPADSVAGIGFDATCSLVVLDKEGMPLTVSLSGDNSRNIIMWMDHRATDQTARINATNHPVLQRVGGKISPEMETPKLLWLKENMPETWRNAGAFYDLPDFLTHRATGSSERSACSLACKWTYEAQKMNPDDWYGGTEGWNVEYFRQIGLGDLADEGFARLGSKVNKIGYKVGNGLTDRAAKELGGLRPGTSVGVSVIDAHCGGIGSIGTSTSTCWVESSTMTKEQLQERLVLVAGTSSCHMTCTVDDVFVSGVWGPYSSAMIPGMSLLEGGQSITGAALDHVVNGHARIAEVRELAQKENKGVYPYLNVIVRKLARDRGLEHVSYLTKGLDVLPDFHGNRSPLADPNVRGILSGLPMSSTVDDLALLYYATLQGLVFGTRFILERMKECGHDVKTIVVCGGMAKNIMFVEEVANICGVDVILPAEEDTVLLGGAILGAVANGCFYSVMDGMGAMARGGSVIKSTTDASLKSFIEKKYQAYKILHETHNRISSLMA